mmetsp:Transcript_17349/g.32906  ORF Transcript_17349/g.32906 Transcript_17349/m.32906 type:complete len:288 (-) Transcript_17349:100-963(-)|eukprot:scaffold15910_cov193-Amphora_coffeaeformis.AAC.5
MSLDPTEVFTVQTTDKYGIHVKKWAPSGVNKPKAQLVVMHGYLEHGGRYAELGAYLASQDIIFFALDLRGHGKSQGQRAYCWSFAQYHLDMEAVLTKVDADVPLFLLGHSAGGLLLLDYLKTHDNMSKWWKGVIISSPFLKPAELVPQWKVYASKILAWIAPVLSVAAGEITGDVLTHDKAKAKEHDEDPLNLHNATVGWGYAALKTQNAILNQWKPPTVGDMPLLLTFGSADPVADPAVNREFFAKLESKDKTVDERKDKFHEILNETDRAELFREIKDWMMARIK